VSIDLERINGVEFLPYEGEKHGIGSVRVGSGARWSDVYEVLEGVNESVVGGRSADVGVGGFILGG
jgi:FAD/FMN-containing dehydrogenase